jgi:hypothetical protein
MSNVSDSLQPPHTDKPMILPASGRAMGRWQFSLRGLLLFTLLVAMACALFTTGRRLRQAEAELADYRREYGILEVENPAMLCAVAAWTAEPTQWRWKVHFPPGKYEVGYATSEIPYDGIPAPQGGIAGDFSGPADVSAAVYKDPRDGEWKVAIAVGGEGTTGTVWGRLMEARSSETSGVRWNNPPTIISPDKPLVLLRKRVGKKGKNGLEHISHTETSDGLMLWIRRIK